MFLSFLYKTPNKPPATVYRPPKRKIAIEKKLARGKTLPSLVVMTCAAYG